MKKLAVLFSFLLISPWACYAAVQGSSISPPTTTSKEEKEGSKFVGSQPDMLVSASPLIVAATCKDGVALIATYADTDCDDENWQENYKGTTRIQQLDNHGSTLVAAGWRTDCDWLASLCRTVAAEEHALFGPSEADHMLPQEVSLSMAEIASTHARPMSAVGLIACRDSTLFLVDATGAYPVRAHAVGMGAKIINKRLRKTDFSGLGAEECAHKLLEILGKISDDDEEKDWKPSKKQRVEVAVTTTASRKMRRIRQPFLFSEISE